MTVEWRIDAVEQGVEPVTHLLAFDEGVAYDREDLVAEAVKYLETLPGVTGVEHVEREFVEIAARDLKTSQLTEALERWWEAAEREKRPWMVAVDRAAGILAELTAAHGYRRDGGWQVTRVLDAELSHAISLDHAFGRRPGEHSLTVTGFVRLALPRAQAFTVVRWTGALEDGTEPADLAETITGRVLPSLDPLSTVEVILERWRDGRSILEGGRRPYTVPEGWLYAQVLISRGLLAEAGQVYQLEFEGCQPRQRQHLLEQAAKHGVPRPVTAANPHLSIAEEATLAAWQANTVSMVDQLCDLTGLRLDGSSRSVDELWAWLRDSPDRLQATFADATPALGKSYYGVLTGSDIASGRLPFEPWYRVTVELVTAYLGHVVMERAPGTRWGIGGDGELAMAWRGGTGLLWRVCTIVHEAFGAPAGDFRPRRLSGLADDMVRWVNDGTYSPWMVLLEQP
ncbi:MAG TPA: hypothetical protein VF062_09295 [Candidatus Limnocylindrales bacterium]